MSGGTGSDEIDGGHDSDICIGESVHDCEDTTTPVAVCGDAPPPPACNDGSDNDGDGQTDFPRDPGCTSANDTSELGTNECDDGVDNDGDGDIDYPDDSDCSDPTDTTESSFECSDGLDNDGDGQTDYPRDPGCTSATDTSELGTNECDDVIDNDGDGRADYPNDPDCSDPSDTDESPAPTECSDGSDNDSDGLTDYPNDPSCSSPSDDDERNPEAACEDGQDNDSDGQTDFPRDQGCSSESDLSEGGDGDCQEERVRMKVDFTHIQNSGGGNASNSVVLGDGTVVAENQYFDVMLNGNAISDPGFVTGTPSLAIKRNSNGSVEIRGDGNGNPSSIEDVHGTITIQSGTVDQLIDNSLEPVTNGDRADVNGNATEVSFEFYYYADDTFTIVYDPDQRLCECQDGTDNDTDGNTDYPADPGCDSAQDDQEAKTSDLSVVKSTMTTQPITPGDSVTYTLRARNHGPDTATNVVVADPIPSGLTFNSGASDNDCVQQGNSILCNNLTLNNGSSRAYTVVFDISSSYTCGTNINNSASVSTSATDPNSSNNQDQALTPVVCFECSD